MDSHWPHPERGGPPRVLLLHGMGNAGSVWDGLRPRLPGGAQASAPELPWAGVGTPEWSHHPDPTVWVRQAIDEARDALGGVDVVVAHSFSATVLVNLLAGTRDGAATPVPGLSGLVLVGPFYRAEASDFEWELMTGLVAAFLRTMKEGIRLVAGERGNPELFGAMAQKVCERIGPYGWTRFFEQYLATPFAAVSRIDLPCLVVSGERDGTAPPGESATLAAALPAGRLWSLPGQGHFPMLELPDELAAGIGRFFDELRGSSATTLRTTPGSEFGR